GDRRLPFGPARAEGSARRTARRGNAPSAREPPMITRRALIKWGVVAPALVAGPQAALARFPEGLDALVVDRRHLAAGHAGLTAPKVYPIDGDVTALWYDVLDLTWRRPGFVLGGVTGRDALFVLETL